MPVVLLGDVLQEHRDRIGCKEGGAKRILGVSNETGLHESNRSTAKNRERYLCVEESYFAYNPMRINVGSIGLSESPSQTGVISPDYVVFSAEESIYPPFLLRWLKSPEGQKAIRGQTTGSVRERLYFKSLAKIQIDLPDLGTQRRIVETLENVQSYRTTSTCLSDSVTTLRQTILDLAVRGKLVPQDPEDEPASELLNRIAEESDRLVQEKVIKKPKELPDLPEQLPWACPPSWSWTHLGKLTVFINGDRSKNYPNKSEYVAKGVPWINTGHIDPDGSLSAARMYFISQEKFDSLRGGKIQQGDLVYCLRGATFGKTAIVDPFQEGGIASSLMIIRPFSHIFNRYVYRYLTSPFGRSQIFRFDNGSAQPNLSANSVRMYHFCLPPLAEQKRIVEKVDSLMALCDQLESRLSDSSELAEKLASSVVSVTS